MKTLVGACLGVVLLASQASAECAFVLWAKLHKDNRPIGWDAFQTYERLAECQSTANDFNDKPPFAPQPRNTVYDRVLWFCFPDTLDPRAAKGK